MSAPSFFAELKRRNVYKVAITYAVVAWLLIQAASILFPTFDAPPWVMKALVVLLALGFVLAVFVSWAFEATPEGLKRTASVDHGAQPTWSARKFSTFIIVIALLAVCLLAFNLLRSKSTAKPTAVTQTVAPQKPTAVLPLLNESGDPKDEYFRTGYRRN